MSRPPTTLYFVRHGESEANRARVFAGQTDSPLTDQGRQQAEAVAAVLEPVAFDRIVTSDLSRTRETAEIIARRRGLAVEIFPGLREIDAGSAVGRSFDELHGLPEWDDGRFVRWEGGESLEAVLDRGLRVISELVAQGPGQTICVVGHGGITRILLSHFLGVLPHLDRYPGRNTAVSIVVTDGVVHRVERLGDDAHVV